MSSQKNISKDSLEHLTELQDPGDQPQEPSKVYIDSVSTALVDDQSVIIISGSFPDGCSHLKSATHHTSDDKLYLELTAWRNADQMCTQALTPFTYIYDELTEEELSQHSEVIINDSSYNL